MNEVETDKEIVTETVTEKEKIMESYLSIKLKEKTMFDKTEVEVVSEVLY